MHSAEFTKIPHRDIKHLGLHSSTPNMQFQGVSEYLTTNLSIDSIMFTLVGVT